MLKDLFLTPGRFLTKLFAKEKKRTYRSTRSRPTESLWVAALSVICWLVLAGCLIYSIDKAGLLKQALDVGVEAATGGAETQPLSEPGEPEAESGSATGTLTQNGQAPPSSTTGPPAVANQGQTSVETELWLVILHTIPKSAREEAERRQTQYLSRGLRVDILDTDAFPRLRSGSWIIALGPFETRAAAVAASEKAAPFNNGLMIRRGL